MKHITHGSTTLRLHVETIHGDYFEFVIRDAEDRTNTDYYGELERMLDDDLKPWGSVDEIDCYYTMQPVIDVPDIDDVPHVLKVANDTVARWKSKYNINGMIGHPYND